MVFIIASSLRNNNKQFSPLSNKIPNALRKNISSNNRIHFLSKRNAKGRN
jgi:hypothetical protein